MPRPRPLPSPTSRTAVACLSTAPWNPYLELLARALAAEGIPSVAGGRMRLRWLAGPARRRVRWLHVHWPESLYRFGRGPASLRRPLSWLKLALFAGRLLIARTLGYRIAWMIHQPLPHERVGLLDAAGARVLAWLATVLVAHDEETAARAARLLGVSRGRITVVPHGSYVDVYPPGEGRAAARAELAVGDARMALCFGELRGYKDVDVLLAAFARVEVDAVLVVAGNSKDDRVADALREAAARDDRIRVRSGFVPVDGVSDLFAAADVAVLPRGDGGTSGSLILALSLGVPVVAADRATYRDLAGDEAGWFFEPGDAASLAGALGRGLAAPDDERARRGRAAARRAARLDWAEAGRRLAALLR